eukprot:330109-Amphidinium_carterae.1
MEFRLVLNLVSNIRQGYVFHLLQRRSALEICPKGLIQHAHVPEAGFVRLQYLDMRMASQSSQVSAQPLHHLNSVTENVAQ